MPLATRRWVTTAGKPPPRFPMISHTHEEPCRRIVDENRDAIVFADRDGRIALWNTGAEDIFGYGAREALGQNLDMIIPEKLRERHSEGCRRVMETGSTRYGREPPAVPALRRDGTRISIEFSIVLVRSPSGEVLGAAAIIRDVTARWMKEKELRDRLAALANPGSHLEHNGFPYVAPRPDFRRPVTRTHLDDGRGRMAFPTQAPEPRYRRNRPVSTHAESPPMPQGHIPFFIDA